MADPRLRTMKIKTGVVKRLGQEKRMYAKEAVDLKEKVEKMKVDGKDEYDIRKQEEVLEESRNMIPDCQRRLDAAQVDLDSILSSAEDLSDTDEYKAAKIQLNESYNITS